MNKQIEQLDWDAITNEMHSRGYAVVDKFLSEELCRDLIHLYTEKNIFRKTVVMERYRFGLGEYKYFNYPLPELLQKMRKEMYPKLVPVANAWMNALNIEVEYPDSLSELLKRCKEKDQVKPTALILKYGEGGFNTLHQDLYGDIYFPIQMVLFLSDSDVDYNGGEFVLTEQVPRAQSKAIVLHPKRGDVLLFTTNFRPVKGTRGYYRANMRHGVSEVRKGERYTLGIIYHDAVS